MRNEAEPAIATGHIDQIDGLRGIAVSAVVVDHFFGEAMPSGFVGVDIFFVISGFVITKYLRERGDGGRLGWFLGFYARRIKRLFPALLVCVVVTTALFLLVTNVIGRDVYRTGGLALLGLSNIYLHTISTDYFSLDAALNPFTHTWSLGIEEQFYLVFPLLALAVGLVGTGKRRPSTAPGWLMVVTVVSLVIFVVTDQVSRSAAFYLLPGRMWELSVGSLAWLHVERRRDTPGGGGLALPLLAILVGLLFLPRSFQIATVILSVATTTAVLATMQADRRASAILTLRALTFLGEISYSLYLWHWSVLVLGRWTLGDTAPVKIGGLALVFAVAILSHRYVETPLRYARWTSTHARTIGVGFSLALAACVACFTFVPRIGGGHNDILSRLFGVEPVPEWRDIACHGGRRLAKFADPFDHCLNPPRTAEKPRVLYLIGDSHAAHLVFMLEKSLGPTAYALGFVNTEDERDFPKGTTVGVPYRDTPTLTWITAHARPGDIVMVSFHRGRLNEVIDGHLDPAVPVAPNDKAQAFLAAMKDFVAAAEHAGLRVVLARDTPLLRVKAASGACALQIKLFGHSNCEIDRAQDLHTRSRQDQVYDALAKTSKIVSTWDPAPLIYGSSDHVDVLDRQGRYRMWDWNHITQVQSEALADDFSVFLRGLDAKPSPPAP